jgi:hypothetical protein
MNPELFLRYYSPDTALCALVQATEARTEDRLVEEVVAIAGDADLTVRP